MSKSINAPQAAYLSSSSPFHTLSLSALTTAHSILAVSFLSLSLSISLFRQTLNRIEFLIFLIFFLSPTIFTNLTDTATSLPHLRFCFLRLVCIPPAMTKANGEVHSVSANGGIAADKPFKIFVGYDPREDLAYEVCRYSLLKRASIPVEIIPIKQSELRKDGLYWRDRGNLESTEFSFTRFLTPCLANYQGWAMFVDCDFLYLADIKELWDFVDDKYAIMCVQHDYTPKETTKMDGAVQTVYPRKNWSSMVLYNCGHPKNRVLTPEIVNTQTGAFLHRFQWLEDEDIGSIPFVWNFLEGHNKVVEGDATTFPKAIHYTRGGPWFEAWKNCDFADLWVNEMQEYMKESKKLTTN